jgi:hypothetical protein
MAAAQGSRRVMQEDLRAVEFETSEDVDVTPTFDNMGLREELLRGIYAYGKCLFLRLLYALFTDRIKRRLKRTPHVAYTQICQLTR